MKEAAATSKQPSTTDEAGSATRRQRRALRFGLEPAGDGEYRIAAVHLRRGHVNAYECATLRAGESEAELRRLGYKRGLPAVLTLPRHDAILKWVRLPSKDPKQIAQMVRFETRALAPWLEHETAFSHHIISVDTEGYTSLLLVIMRIETIRRHMSALHALGVYPTRVELTTFSLGRLLAGLGDDERPAIARAVGGTFEYTRYWSGHPLFSRGADGEDLRALVQDSVALDERRHGSDQACTVLVLASDGDSARPYGEFSAGRSAVDLTDFRSPALNGVGSISADIAGCLGAALSADQGARSEDLLPEREQRRLHLRAVLWDVAQVVALMAACTALLYVLSVHFIRQEQRFATEARLEIETLRADVGDLDQKSAQVRLLRTETAMVSAPLEVVLELYARTPNSVAINFMHYNGTRPLVLAGEAASFDAVNDFLAALNESPRFSQVKLSHTSRAQQGQSDLVEFRVSAQVKEAAR